MFTIYRKILAPDLFIAFSINEPAITKLSLFASATLMPSFIAHKVGSIPEEPTRPFIIKSLSLTDEISSNPFLPFNSSIL